MSIADTDTSIKYSGNGVTTQFAIPFAYLSGEVDNIKVLVRDTSVDPATETEKTNPTHWTFDDATDPTAIIFGTAPSATDEIYVYRDTTINQETDFSDNTVEAQFDRLTLMIQEVNAKIKRALLFAKSAGLVDKELPYPEDGKYLGWDGTDLSNLSAVAGPTGAQGPKGDKGDKGDQGIQGIQGPAGVDGANGNDGVFSQIANETEAKTGSDNTKGMTPLRTKQALDNALVNYTLTSAINSKNSSQDLEISNLKQRATTLEQNQDINTFAGKQRIQNNVDGTVIAKVALEGKEADTPELGYGNPLSRNNTGTEWSEVTCLVKRSDDSETRFVQVTLVMHYSGGQWWIGRQSTTVLNGGNPDGLTFSVDTDGDGVGLVSYTSDNMAGGNHSGEIFWFGREIPVTIDGAVS